MKPHQNLKKIRELKNYTQEFLAFSLGISQVAYSRIESGKTRLTVKRLLEIAAVLEIDPILLLTLDVSIFFKPCGKCEKVVNSFQVPPDEKQRKLEARIENLESLVQKYLSGAL